MADLIVKDVISKKDLSTFLRIPWRIYKDDPNWVPPLLSEQRRMLSRKVNPFFKHADYKAWILLSSGIPSGRILAYVDNAHNSYYNEKTGFMGFFECIDHQESAETLFDSAREWLKQQGMQLVSGPINFSIGNECGIQLDGYNTMPYLQMNYTPPYYVALFERSGFSKAHDLYAYKLVVEESLRHAIFPRLKKITDKIRQQQDLTFRPVNMKRYTEELESINTIFNETMRHNWGFVPSDMEELLFAAGPMKMIADPQLILFAECCGKVAGCSITLPDVNQALKHINGRLFPFGWIKFLYYKQKINRIRLYLLGILEENRFKGLDVAFYYFSILNAFERGYKEAELSWVSEDNATMIQIIEKIGATRYKTYRMFKKSIP